MYMCIGPAKSFPFLWRLREPDQDPQKSLQPVQISQRTTILRRKCVYGYISFKEQPYFVNRPTRTFVLHSSFIRNIMTSLLDLPYIFKKRDKISLDRPPLFQSVAERSAAAAYSKLHPQKQDPCQVIDVGENTLKLVQGGLENMVSIDRAIMAPSHGRCCDSPVTEEYSASSSTQSSASGDRSQQGSTL